MTRRTYTILIYTLLTVGSVALLCSIAQCEVDGDGDGFEISDGDCDDQNDEAYPGAPEFCNSYDEDCDGVVDNECCPDESCGCKPVCVTGLPCGNTCIDPEETCHVGAGTACYGKVS